MSEDRFWEIVAEIQEIDRQRQELWEKKEKLLDEQNDLSEELFGVRNGQVISVPSLVKFFKNLIEKKE